MDIPSEKHCPKCNLTKPLSEFHKNKNAKYGVHSYCKACVIAHRSKNREYFRQSTAQWRLDNPEKRKAQDARKDPAKVRQWNVDYYHRNREQEIRRAGEYKKNNRDQQRKYRREHYRKNIEKMRIDGRERYKRTDKEKLTVWRRNRRARLRNAEGTHTLAETQSLFAHQEGKCYYCHKRLINPFTKEGEGEKPHLDHVIPLKRGGRNDISNLVWACEYCNTSKGDKLIHEWLENCDRIIKTSAREQ